VGRRLTAAARPDPEKVSYNVQSKVHRASQDGVRKKEVNHDRRGHHTVPQRHRVQ